MRIGVDACCWANRRGFGRFTRELLGALVQIDHANEYLFFVDRQSAAEEIYPEGVQLIVAQTGIAPTAAASAYSRRSFLDLWALSRQVFKQHLDLFFFPAVYSYFPILNRCKVIVTFHDMIADHHPERVFPNTKGMVFWKLKQHLALTQAHTVLTVSENSKAEILKYYGLPSQRVRVIPEASSAIFEAGATEKEVKATLTRYQLETGSLLLLYVGGLSPHKNLRVLLQAYRKLRQESRFGEVKLLLVGDYENDSFYSEYPALREYVEQHDLQNEVIFAGYVEDRELVHLYHAASVLVFPSLEEGFGLPAIEAMACGTPVVAADRGSLPEVLGEAGRFFDPSHPETLLQQLREVLSNSELRGEMADSGLARSRGFTWKIAAEKTLAIFRDVAG